MAKRFDRTEVVKINPSFLSNFVGEDTSLDGMDEYVILPYLKTIQGQCQDKELKKLAGEGALVMSPAGVVVYQDEGEAVQFVPLHFHTEFQKHSAFGDADNPYIMDRTFDPTSEMAKRAKDKDNRTELYEGDEKKPDQQKRYYRYVEALCFAGVIYGEHQNTGQQVVVVFSKGEFGTGRKFISAIKMRRENIDGTIVKVPLWSQVWSFTTSLRPAVPGGAPWWGIDFTPAEPNLIDPSDAEEFSAFHAELHEAYVNNKLRVDMSGEDGGDEEDVDDADLPM